MIRCLVIVLLFVSGSVSGQTKKIYFDNFTTDQGLSDNYTNCVLQDHKGWIWVGTGMGIERFDGLKFKKYLITTSEGKIIESFLVRNFFESTDGILFACIEEYGLVYYNRKKDRFDRIVFKDIPILCNISVKDLAEDKQGNIWAATKNGIYKIDFKNRKTTVFSHNENDDKSIIANYARRLKFDNKTNLWVGTQRGLERFDTISKIFIHYSQINPLLKDDILDICIDKSDRILVGTGSHGIIIIHNEGKLIKQLLPDSNNERSYKINAIYQDKDNQFWIGTRGGVYLFNERNKKLRVIENNPLETKSLIHNSVLNIYQDQKGDMWFATRGGLSYMAKEKQIFENYQAFPNNNHYLNNSEVYCIWTDMSDNIWLGTENGGINILDRKKGTFQYLTQSGKNSLSSNCIKSIQSDGKGHVYIGTFMGGLNTYHLKTRTIKQYKHDKKNIYSLSDNLVWDICIDKNSEIWIGTSAGLDRFDPLTGTFHHIEGIGNSGNGVNWIGVDSQNDLWIGADNIMVYRPGYGILKTFPEMGRDFFEDSKGRYWIMTGNRGIVQYDKYSGPQKVYDERAGISSKLTYCMLEDSLGRLWISTANGLSCFEPKTASFKNYYSYNGLQGNQFHYGASGKTKNGELIFGGVKGFNIFDPYKIIENTYKPPVYVTDLKVFNQSVVIGNDKKSILYESLSEMEEVTIPFKYNVLTFEFAALNYTNSNKNRYRYILEGFDNNWTETSETRTITYTNLNPGTYTLKVKGGNDNGVWNDIASTKSIVILPPFHRTIWFKLLVIIVIVTLIFLVLVIILKRRELKNALEIEKVKAQNLHELDTFKLQFFTNISHEIKTPLTLIVSPLKKILKQEIADGIIKENLRLMEKNAEHLMGLVTQLLDYRKLQEGKLKVELKKGDIVQFCKTVLATFDSVIKEKELKLKFSGVPSAIFTRFDSDKLKNILNNLFSNAVKYNKVGGTIEVTVTIVNERGNDFHERDNHFIKIVVKDTGIGIKKEDLSKIFNRFYVADEDDRNGSSGIGLTFTKELVELQQGKITVDSVEGFGSVFTVLLPFLEEIIETDNKSNNQNELSTIDFIKTREFEIEQKNKKILLVVEDNPDVRKFIKLHFKDIFIVLEAENGKVGLEIAVKTIPDIVVSDIMMPVLNGREFCEKVKKDERTSHIPIILLTALSSKDDLKSGLVKGADDYITKPFDIDILQTKIDNLLSLRKSLQEKYSRQLILEPSHVSIKSPDEKFLDKTIRVIEDNMDDSTLDIDKLVHVLGVSRMQLYRKIAALTNMTVKEFVSDIRLKRAAQILSEKKMNISDVAYSVGFNDLSYFGKCFKRKYGVNASEYYQKMHKEV